MILLDTDHVSILRHREDSRHAVLVAKLLHVADVVVSVISMEEQMRAWLAELRRQHANPLQQVQLYLRLEQLVGFYQEWEVLSFDDLAAKQYQELSRQKIRVGPQDLKIASIALRHNALLLSSNLVHFQRVPGLRVEDWVYGRDQSQSS